MTGLEAQQKDSLSSQGVSEMLQPETATSGVAGTTEDDSNSRKQVLRACANVPLEPEKLDEELAKVAEIMAVPVFNARWNKNVKTGWNILQDLFVLRNIVSQQDKYKMESDYGITRILSILDQKEVISEDIADKTCAEIIIRRVDEAKWGYSDQNRQLATKLLKRFEPQGWGKQSIQRDPIVHGVQRECGCRAKSAHGLDIEAPIPANDDPIFGTHGPMHGTMIKYNRNDPKHVTKAVILNHSSTQKTSKVHGHNGMVVGRFFLRLMAALAQGAHGAVQAGIYGTDTDGAFSIIVSGTYNELETDSLQSFDYCTPGSMENKSDSTVINNKGLQALRRSAINGKAVRLLRGANSKFQHAPAFGYRYDGLYVVKDEAHRFNTRGGIYATFRLERVAGQPPVDLSRPNGSDRHHNEMLKHRLG